MSTPDQNASREPRGKPLFAELIQPMNRFGHGMLIFVGGAFFIVSLVMTPSRFLHLTLARLPMLVFYSFIVWLFRHTHKVYGSPEGLEVVQWGKLRAIPWSHVGEYKVLPWFLGFPARIVCLTLYETPTRTITFYATSSHLEDFEALRVGRRSSAANGE